MREITLEIINTSQGIKDVELALKVMAEVGPSKFDPDQFQLTLAQLVHTRQIIEIEYVLPPNLDYRTKSIYFPKGTRLGINNGRGL